MPKRSGSLATASFTLTLLWLATAFGQTPADIVGMSIACSNDRVYVWYANRTVSIGTTENLGAHQSYLPPHPYNLPRGKTPADIIGVGIAGNDHVYAWYRDGTVSSGTSTDLDRYRAPYPYSLPPGKTPGDVVGMAIACSNDHVYVWYRDGRVSSGTSSDLDQYRHLYSYSLPPGRSPSDLVELGIAGNDHVYAWFRDGTVSSGTSDDLDKYRALYSYSWGAPTPSSPAPFDLSLNGITPNGPPADDNGIWFSPVWGWQITHPGELPDPNGPECHETPYSSCTTQTASKDTAKKCSTFGHDGHYNWAAGTYAGRIYWNDHSCNACDDDYNFRIVPADKAGLTTENGPVSSTGEKSIKIEFSADETINRFRTPWWDSFHRAVDESFSAANSMIVGPDGRPGVFGIVTGMVGLDCAHVCASELHPAWALALKVKDDPSDEMWAILVRRWGNEGFCSSDQHYLQGLPANTYTFRLPWRLGASSVSVLDSTIFRCRLGDAAGPDVSWAPNQGVLVSFTMQVPRTGEGEVVNGELHLRWTGLSDGTIGAFEAPPGLIGTIPASPQEEQDEPESRLAQLLAGMTPVQRATFEARMPRRTISIDDAPLRPAAPPRRVASLPTRLARANRPTVTAVPDPQLKAADQQLLDTLRAIYGDNLPEVIDHRRVAPPR